MQLHYKFFLVIKMNFEFYYWLITIEKKKIHQRISILFVSVRAPH